MGYMGGKHIWRKKIPSDLATAKKQDLVGESVWSAGRARRAGAKSAKKKGKKTVLKKQKIHIDDSWIGRNIEKNMGHQGKRGKRRQIGVARRRVCEHVGGGAPIWCSS